MLQNSAASLPLATGEEWKALEGRLPASIVATGNGLPGSEWMYDDCRDLRADAWLVGLPNPLLIDGGVSQIRFDALVDIDGMTLDNISLRPLGLTKRLACLNICRKSLERDTDAAAALQGFSLYFDWLIRFRLSRRLLLNADLTRCDFDDYLNIVLKKGLFGLVPIPARLEKLVTDIRTGRNSLSKQRMSDGLSIDLQALSHHLGIPAHALAINREFRDALIESVAKLDLEYGFKLNEPLRIWREPPVRDKPVASITLRQMLEPWQQLADLTRLGYLGHDPLSFDPFEDTSLRRLAIEFGSPSVRTATLLPNDLFRLLTAAVRWMSEHGETVIAALKWVENIQMLSPEYRGRAPELDAWWGNACIQLERIRLIDQPRVRIPGVDTVLSTSQAVKYLMAACAIVIATFGARRRGEIQNLQTGCVSQIAPNVWGLSIYIEKSLQDIDAVPVPALVRTAVDMLDRLSNTTRDFAGGSWLFRVFSARNGKSDRFIGLDLSAALKDFPALCSLSPPEGRDRWNLTSRQFRRAFAVLYYHGNSLASLDDLSQHLRHFDPETTWTYVYEIINGEMGELRERIEASTSRAAEAMSSNERELLDRMRGLLLDLKERRAAFEEVRREALAFHLIRVHQGTERLAGRGARKVLLDLEKMVATASAQVRVGSRLNDPNAILAPLERILLDHARDHWLEPVPGIPAHCTANPNDEANQESAECLRVRADASPSEVVAANPGVERHRPAPAFTADYLCLQCVHCVCLDGDQRRLFATMDRLEAVASEGVVDVLTRDAKARYQRLKDGARKAGLGLGGDP